jgi:hypothetical protein
LLFAVHKAGCERASGFKGTGDAFHFLLAEFASAPAGKYAIIVVHKFLLDVAKTTALGLISKKGARRTHRLIGAFAVEYAHCNQGACSQRPETAAYLLDFLLVQVTSTLPNQYSILVIHNCSPFVPWVR